MGHVAREDALAFGWTLSALSVATMWLFVNVLAASLLAFTVFFYVVVYTLWLKRRTPQNIVIGGLAGALPPAIGWAAVTGSLSLAPHGAGGDHLHVDAAAFLGAVAVALARIMPAPACRCCRWCKGKTVTRRHILAYTLLLAPLGVVPAFIGLGGMLYLVASATHGLLDAAGSLRHLARNATRCRSPPPSGCSAFRCFMFSCLSPP